ncbi:MAG: ABC transporter ATP-binding protein [Treponema sp.]|nr:ABC transporter ATP-binding protein [Treponema sp.]
MNKHELLRLEGIKKSFGTVEVLKGIDLTVDKGEFITILGPSGCGKTTLLRVIAGLEDVGGGRVFLDSRDVTADEPNKRNVRMVFQNYALFPHMNVESNIGYSLRLRHASNDEIKKAVTGVLELVQLPGYGKRMPSELSGGQKQRVAVARALVNEPSMLLLDEPLGALDLQLRRQMQIELKRLQSQLGITFIYITHDQEEALTMSDRIAVMRNGLFEQIGSAEEIYNKPLTSYVARFVGSANVFCRADSCIAVRSEHVDFMPVNTPEAKAGGDVGSGQTVNRGAQTADNGQQARIIARSFTGGQVKFTAVFPDGSEVTSCRQGMDSSLQVGMQVTVSWLPENAVPISNTD